MNPPLDATLSGEWKSRVFPLNADYSWWGRKAGEEGRKEERKKGWKEGKKERGRKEGRKEGGRKKWHKWPHYFLCRRRRFEPLLAPKRGERAREIGTRVTIRQRNIVGKARELVRRKSLYIYILHIYEETIGVFFDTEFTEIIP